MSTPKLLTTREAAEALGVSYESILNWLRRGYLRGYKLGGDKAGWKISETDLLAFLEAHANRPAAALARPDSRPDQ